MSELTKVTHYITWKQAAYALIGFFLLTGSVIAWVDSTKLDVDDASEIKEDIKIIKKCLIEKKCGD